jgi:hypothetical protein
MTKGYIAADVAIKTAYFSFVAAALDVVVGRCSPLRLFGQGRCCIFRTGSKRGTDSDLLFVTEVICAERCQASPSVRTLVFG